jgi:hypothetical protein
VIRWRVSVSTQGLGIFGVIEAGVVDETIC